MTGNAHSGTVHRADWRFLLPPGPRRHLLVGCGGSKRLQEQNNARLRFLQTDGWVEQITVGTSTTVSNSTTGPDPDVLLVPVEANVETALAVAAPDAAAVVELGRSPITRRNRLRALRSNGFSVTDLYLVTPNLTDAKRYVPLHRPEATAWLLGRPPPLGGEQLGARQVMVQKAAAIATTVGARAIARLAASPATEALAGAGTEGLAIAMRGPARPDREAPILMTSGHDEGSRAVLVHLGQGSTTPTTVTKVSSRPRYNDNITNEVTAIRSIRDTVEGTAAIGTMPDIIDWDQHGDHLLQSSTEAYAGRWTAADLCHRVPDSRHRLLKMVLAAIDEFSIATQKDSAVWSEELFDQYVATLFDRYRALPGNRCTLEPFQAALAGRSAAMAGRTIPLVQRHYDPGPWNVVIDDTGTQLTIIDWELAPPRSLNRTGFGGGDQLYFAKYWLHTAMETTSLADEQRAFEFLPGEAPTTAARGLRNSFDRLQLDPGFVPLLTGHVWLESALYTAARRAGRGGDPGAAALYLETLDDRHEELLDFWRPAS